MYSAVFKWDNLLKWVALVKTESAKYDSTNHGVQWGLYDCFFNWLKAQTEETDTVPDKARIHCFTPQMPATSQHWVQLAHRDWELNPHLPYEGQQSNLSQQFANSQDGHWQEAEIQSQSWELHLGTNNRHILTSN